MTGTSVPHTSSVRAAILGARRRASPRRKFQHQITEPLPQALSPSIS